MIERGRFQNFINKVLPFMVNCKLFSWPNLELKIVSDYHVIETQPDSDSGDGQLERQAASDLGSINEKCSEPGGLVKYI